jgi:chromosome partitioning protein
MKPPYIFAAANQKGGVGKTTTAITLGSSLSIFGHRVLLIDLDPQASLTNHLAVEPEKLEYSVADIMVSDSFNPADAVINKYRLKNGGSIDLIPSNINLARIEAELSVSKGGGLKLKERLKFFYDNYDYIIIDSSPALSVLLISAVAASDEIIIPVMSDFLSVRGVELLISTIEKIEKALDRRCVYRLLVTMFDRRTSSSVKSLEYFKNKYKNSHFNSIINIDTRFRDASMVRKPLTYIDINSRGAIDYINVAKEIIDDFNNGAESWRAKDE